jgi:hypothetical protein
LVAEECARKKHVTYDCLIPCVKTICKDNIHEARLDRLEKSDQGFDADAVDQCANRPGTEIIGSFARFHLMTDKILIL